MTPWLRRVGLRGAGVLAITGLAGVLLAAHGYAGWRTPIAPGAIGRSAAASRPAGSASAGPAAAGARSTAPAANRPGPLLSSQSFAPYAYQVWPGPRSAAAQSALAGLTVTVHQQGTGLSVTAGVNGQQVSPRYYPLGARVYIVEASFGDDSGNSDYNLGDDGIVVTDGQGRIVQ